MQKNKGGVITTAEGPLEVVLRNLYTPPPGKTDQKAVPAKRVLLIRWVSAKIQNRINEAQQGLSTVFNGHIIQIVNEYRQDGEPYWIKVAWDDVSHPRSCVLTGSSYALGGVMRALYCATKQDFVGVEPGRADDIKFCPLCGAEL